MTLEDFFTLTEMKHGLVTCARVEELISVMQQQKDCSLSNASDTARQWSTVASTLAATESKDCLEHFVKLNGLSYLNKWLQEALKFHPDIAEFVVEEFLKSLLGSLERLPIFREDSVASGIQSTVEQLVGFKSLDIKEKARALSERWKHGRENSLCCQDMSKDEKSKIDMPKPPDDINAVDRVNSTHPVSDSTCREAPEGSKCREESAGSACLSLNSNVAGCRETSQIDNSKDGRTSTERQNVHASSLNSAVANASLEADMDTLPSLAPSSCQENFSKRDDSLLCPATEIASSVTSCSNVPRDTAENCDASELKDIAEDMKMDVDTKEDSPSKSGQTESCKVPSSSGVSVSSHAYKPGRSVSCNFDAKENKSCTTETLPRSSSIDCVVPKYLRNMDLKPEMQDLLSNGSKLRTNSDSEDSFDRKNEDESAVGAKVVGSESKLNYSRVDSVALHDFPKAARKKTTVEMDEQSELGLEYGEIDALEVARQVAIEVEREVVDYREPFCSSSPDASSEEMGPQCSDGQRDQPVNEEQNGRGSPPGKDIDEASSPKNDSMSVAEADKGPDKCRVDVEMSKPVTHELGDTADQSRCVFDLNEDVCVEEPDALINITRNNPSVNVSVPIAVAASKGAPNLPVSPLRFEGGFGWKGSAATSAFRPPSPRRTPDVEKTSSSHKRKANLIEIDLNVAESGDDAIDLLSANPLPVSSGVLSREDSAEVSSRRADRLKLDLNRLGDDDVSPFLPSCLSNPHQNGDRTMSSASSSSSRQPTARDFDLNDNPTFFDAMGSHNLSRFSSKGSGMNASSKPDNHVITIMGSKIAERKAYQDEVPISFMGNGSSADASAMASRPMMPYGHVPLPGFGYSGPVMGPPMPFPPPFYGHGSMPYMVDSRGATVVPQILSTTPGLNTAPSVMPSFLMTMPNTLPGFNGAGSSQSGLDLNSGFMSLEPGSRESGSFRNFFMQGQAGLMEDQVRAAPQPGAAGVSVNRKETETGWEPFTFGYKQVTSWQ